MSHDPWMELVERIYNLHFQDMENREYYELHAHVPTWEKLHLGVKQVLVSEIKRVTLISMNLLLTDE